MFRMDEQTDPAQDFDMPPMATAEDLRDQVNPFISQWRARTIADAIAPRPHAAHFVDKILREGSLSIVYGAPGSLKSLLLMDMMACIVSAQPWLAPLPGQRLDQEVFPTSRVPCLWIDYDNGQDLTDERFQALAATYNIAPDAPLSYYSIALPWLDLSKAENALYFIGLIQRTGAKVIVIDNLGLVKGGASENTDEMQPVMSHLRQIADVTRSAIVLIHHQRKSAAGADATGGARRGETLRGYSGIEAACDLILHVERPAREDFVVITPTKVRRAKPFESIGALFSYQSADGDVLTEARFWAWPTDDAKTLLAKSIKATILDMLGANPGCNQSKLVEHVADWFAAAGQKKPGRDTIRGIIKQMSANAEIEERHGTKTNNREELCYYRS